MKNLERFLNIDEVNSKLRLLHERFDEIHQEFISKKNYLTLLNFGAEAGYYMRSDIAYKGWKVAPLYGNTRDIASINGGLSKFQGLIEINEDLVKFKPNTCLLPKLTQTLLDSGITKRVAISVVYPGKEIAWHIDPDPEKPGLAIIRGLYGLDVVEEEGKESFIYLKNKKQDIEKIKFKNDKFVFFWGRVLHKVENNLTQPRYMICFDTEVPYEQINN